MLTDKNPLSHLDTAKIGAIERSALDPEARERDNLSGRLKDDRIKKIIKNHKKVDPINTCRGHCDQCMRAQMVLTDSLLLHSCL